MTSAGPETPLPVTVTGNITLVLPLAMVTVDGTMSAVRSDPTVCRVMTAFDGAIALSVTVTVAVSLRWSMTPPGPDGPTTVSDCTTAPDGLVAVPSPHAAARTPVAINAAQRR